MNNDIINIIVDWGRIHLLNPEDSRRLVKIEEEFKTLSSICDLKILLSSEITNIGADIFRSQQILSLPELIAADDSQQVWYEAIQAFHSFDILNYILEAFNSMSALEDYKNEFNSLDSLMSKILDWLYLSDFSSLRLTVLNKFRNERLETIPENKRFLYPWYELSSEYRDTTIDMLIEHYSVLFSDAAINKLPEDIKEHYFEIRSELETDKELLAEIKKCYLLDKAIENTLSVRSALLLWRVSEAGAANFGVSNNVLSKGLIRSSIYTLDNVNNELPNLLETMFLAAFCGPILEDSIKIKILKFIEDLLIKSEPTAILLHTDTSMPTHPVLNTLIFLTRRRLDYQFQEDNIISNLRAWYNSEINDDILVKKAFTKWIEMLTKAADSLQETTEDITEHDFQLKVLTLTKRIRESSYQIVPVAITAPLQSVMGEQDEDITQITKNFPQGLFFDMQPDANNEYRLLPQTNHPSVASISDYADIFNFIEGEANVYGSAYGIKSDSNIEEKKSTALITNPLGFLSININSGYEYIVIAISGNMDDCQRAGNAIMASDHKTLESLQTVVYLIFKLTK